MHTLTGDRSFGLKKDNLIFCMWIREWGDSIHSCPFNIHYSTFSGDIEVAFAIAWYLIYMTCQHGSWHSVVDTRRSFVVVRLVGILINLSSTWIYLFLFLYDNKFIILKCFYDLWILIIYPRARYMSFCVSLSA